jgi:hypothetical protein
MTTKKRFISYAEAEVVSGLSHDSLHRMVLRGQLKTYRPVKRRVLLDLDELISLIQGTEVRPEAG